MPAPRLRTASLALHLTTLFALLLTGLPEWQNKGLHAQTRAQTPAPFQGTAAPQLQHSASAELQYPGVPDVRFSGMSGILPFGEPGSVGDGAAHRNGAPGMYDQLDVYIDCRRCDMNHIQRQITFVTYVRDFEQSDVQIFVTDESTGGGGREFEFTFTGRRDFSGQEFTNTFTMDREATSDETQDRIIEAIMAGLYPFMVQLGQHRNFDLQYTPPEDVREPQERIDPWNRWVFEIYAGSLSLNLESNRQSFNSRWGMYADRVTNQWKLRLRPYFNYSFREIDRGEDQDPVVSRQHRHGFDSYAIYSLGDHLSAGLFADYITRIDRNLRHRVRINPGIEYSLLPYDVATRRAITFTYQVGVSEVDYYDETIFQKTAESLMNQELSGNISIRQPWGNVNGGVSASHYFHDFDLRSIDFWGRLSVRLTEGLSLSFSSSFEMIQDQLSLRAGDATLEEILLEQQDLATDFTYSGSISLSYTFGSDFTDVVNTRF